MLLGAKGHMPSRREAEQEEAMEEEENTRTYSMTRKPADMDGCRKIASATGRDEGYGRISPDAFCGHFPRCCKRGAFPGT